MLSANQIEEVKEQAFCKVPSSFYDKQYICKVYPYSIKEIVEMGTTTYNKRLGLLLLTADDIANIIKEKTGTEPTETIHPLEYLLQSAAYDDMFLLELKNTFSTFIKEEVLLLPKINSVLVGGPSASKEKRLITLDNFDNYSPPADETPGQRKMRLLREKVAAVKKKQAQKKGEGQTLVELMEIASTFGIDRNESLYAFYSLVRRHQMREKWQQDLQMICAGADSKKLKTKYWGENPDD